MKKPDVIIAVTNFGALEVKRATSTIPIVVTVAYDAVGTGLVESLARPGGNVTGLSFMAIDLSGKRLELLKGGSKPVPSRAPGRLFQPEQGANDQVASNCGPGAGAFIVASRDIDAR
jgi:hypothetical protein